MASVFSATSATSANTLLTELSQLKKPVERSNLKRFQTFIHYNHSTHPRCYVILYFTIILVTLSVAWLIAGLVRLRQTASYSESCSAKKVQCAANSNLVCSLASSLCLCPDQTYWDSKKQQCLAMKAINTVCSKSEQCDSSKGLICYTDGTCQCPQNTYYDSTNGCTTYLLFGASCLPSSGALCNSQYGLVCDTVTQKCVCSSSLYWSGARCELLSNYSGYCNQNASCNTQVGLFCRLPGADLACDCPLQSKLYTCDCHQGQTWSTATTPNGTSLCVNQGTYQNNCTYDTQCPQSLNLACIGGVCDCATPLWFWSWSSNKCLPCESQGYTLIHYSSQWVCTRLISSSLVTYTNSKTTCTGLGWSLISPIFASDISVIAQAYPTYRLWINMETTLGSSIYNNNIFPNNQSSWNTYVSKSLTAVYSTYIYASQLVSSYSSTMLFEGNTNFDMGHTLCALY